MTVLPPITRVVTGHDGQGRAVPAEVGPPPHVAAPAAAIAPSLLAALRDWTRAAPRLRTLAAQVEDGSAPGLAPLDPAALLAPLPRAPQWLDGSAFLNHGRLMDRAFGNPPLPDFETHPLVYQGASDDFLGPHADLALTDDTLGIDCEGEFGVVVDEVPMGVTAEAALERIRLIVQINDWSARVPGPWEMKRGFGFLQAKPSTGFAPAPSRRTSSGRTGGAGGCALRCTSRSTARGSANPTVPRWISTSARSSPTPPEPGA